MSVLSLVSYFKNVRHKNPDIVTDTGIVFHRRGQRFSFQVTALHGSCWMVRVYDEVQCRVDHQAILDLGDRDFDYKLDNLFLRWKDLIRR